MTIEAAEGVTTGVSAADRRVARCARGSGMAQNRPDLNRRGAFFPLRAPGGRRVLTRGGHTRSDHRSDDAGPVLNLQVYCTS